MMLSRIARVQMCFKVVLHYMCGATTTTITTITAAATAKRIISLFIVLFYVDVVNSVAFKGYYVVMWCSGDKY